VLTRQPKAKLKSWSDALAIKPSVGLVIRHGCYSSTRSIPIIDVETLAVLDGTCATDACSVVGGLLGDGIWKTTRWIHSAVENIDNSVSYWRLSIIPG